MKRNIKVIIFYLICLLEGVWTFRSIWIQSGVILSSLFSSPAKLVLLLFILFGIFIFGCLLAFELGFPRRWFSLENWIVSHNKIFAFIATGILAGCFFVWILAISPLHIPRIHAYYIRWQPVFIWIALVLIQFVLFGLFLKPIAFWLQTLKEILLSLKAFSKIGWRWLNTWQAGLLLLGISFLLGLTKLSFLQFADEGDNLAFGWMISKGYLLYRDLFSQHFPLAYFWSAGVVSIFGNSQAIARISILVLQFGVFAYCMRATRMYLPIGLAAVAWGLTSHFHRGNLVLYDTFDGIFLTATAILVFSILLERSQVKKSTLISIGLLLGLALLSNPLSIYPAIVALAGIFISAIRSDWKSSIVEGFRRSLWMVLPIGMIVGVFSLYLLVSGSLQNFYRDVIWFNANIYNQYTDASPIRLGRILYQLASGLNVFNPQFRQAPSPFVSFGIERFRLANEDLYYSWIFSSLTFRLSILFCVISLLLRRKFLAAIFLYVFSASLLIHAETSWHAIPFIWLSLFAGAYFLVTMFSPPVEWTNLTAIRNSWTSSLAWLGRFAWRAAYIILLIFYSWSTLRGGQFLAQNWAALNDKRYIHQLQVVGDQMKQLSCGQEDAKMLIYPYNPMTYFIAQILPASRYTFMFPWMAQTDLPNMIEDLKNNPSAIVQVKEDRLVWQQYKVKDYLADLISFLNQNYKKIDDTVWISPELAERCSSLSQ